MTEDTRMAFRDGTRKRRQRIATITYDGSDTQRNPAPIILPSTGFLSRILVSARGGIDHSGAGGSLGVDGLAGLFQNINLSVNLGIASLFNTSGAGADIAARWENPWAVTARPFDVTDTTASPFEYALPLNIAGNRRKNFQFGLVNLQDPQIQAILQFTFNALTAVSTLATSGGTSLITITVWMEYFEVPDPRVYRLPPNLIFRTVEERFPQATIVGENIYQVPRQGIMTNFAALPYLNSVRAAMTAIDGFELRLNKTDTIERRNGGIEPLLDATDWGVASGIVPGATPVIGLAQQWGANVPLQAGVLNWNGWGATDVPMNGDYRDSLDTLESTTTEFLLTVAAGTTVVSTDFTRAVRRVFQVLA